MERAHPSTLFRGSSSVESSGAMTESQGRRGLGLLRVEDRPIVIAMGVVGVVALFAIAAGSRR